MNKKQLKGSRGEGKTQREAQEEWVPGIVKI